jgi:hypothetical protein
MIKLGLKSAVSMLVLAMLFGGANRVMAQYQEGDLNHDGVIDVADLTQIIDMMANGTEEIAPVQERAEVKRLNETFTAADFELPSHRKWATKNLGYSKDKDYGLFFAWGDLEGRYGYLPERVSPTKYKDLGFTAPRKFDWPSYQYTLGWLTGDSIEKYQFPDNHFEGRWYDDAGIFCGDEKDHLDDVDDPVRYHCPSGGWRMPNLIDVMELIDTLNTTQSWEKDANGIYGCKFTSKLNGGTLFLPAAGQADDKYVQYRSDMNGFGHCFYWTSNVYPHNSTDAYVLDIDKYLPGMDMRESEKQIAIISWYYRYLGCSIRPVLDDK